MMFIKSNTKNPRKRTPTFRMGGAVLIKARKVANAVNAISEYIPEQGISIAKEVEFPTEVVSTMDGGPYEVDNVIGKLMVLSIIYDI